MSGVVHVERDRVQRYTTRDGLTADTAWRLYRDRRGVLWVGAQGLNRFEGHRFTALLKHPDGPTVDYVASMVEDREGSLWIGTDGRGLYRLKDTPIVAYTKGHGLTNEIVYSLTGDREGGLWINNVNAIWRLHNETLTPAIFQREVVRAMLQAADGSLWIGTEQGLHRYKDRQIQTWTTREGLPSGVVRDIYEDRSGRLWAGTNGGLARLDGQRFSIFTTADGLANSLVSRILERRDGTLAVATYGGVSFLRNGRFTSLTEADGLSSRLTRSLYEDASGTLWIGTQGGGLNRLRDGRITSYTTKDGLFNDVVFAILEDDRGYLWMSCNKGIFRVRKAELEDFAEGRVSAIHSLVFGRAEGMPSTECNSGSSAGWKAPDGRLWFPTLRGLAVVDPTAVQEDPPAPPVLIEHVDADGSALESGAQVAPGAERFTFQFTGLGLATPEKVRFSARLIPFDRDWVDLGPRRTAYYMNLPPGAYRFAVRAAQGEGPWGTDTASFEFRLKPHFHQTWLFVALCAALLAGAMATFHKLRIAHLRHREVILKMRVEQAMAQVKILNGLLPICASCKKIRDDHGYWNQIESYIRDHSQADFSHGICPDCLRTLYPEYAARVTRE